MFLTAPEKSFLAGPTVTDTTRVDTPYVFLGIPFGPPYEASDLYVSAAAADAVRAAGYRWEYASTWSHYDFDTGQALFPDGEATVTDCGNVVGDVRDPDGIWDRAVAAIRPLVEAGRVPFVVGALDSIPPIVVEAFEGIEDINVLHVDAHLDFREELKGVRRGYSSPIRRIREYSCVRDVTQVGLRSMGSARPSDVEDARAAGNVLIPAWQLHEQGVQSVIDGLPSTGRFVITIDCDGLDPSIAPAVGWPEPGGVTYPQISAIVRALASANRIAAVVFTEFRPDLETNGATAQTITRILATVLGLQRSPRRP